MNVSTAQLQGGRERQEDAFVAYQADTGAWVLLVADGLGGHPKGYEASRIGADAALASLLESQDRGTMDSTCAVHRAFMAAHEAVRTLKDSWHWEAPASTLIGGWFDPDRAEAYLASVGDSLAYRLRDGKLTHLFGHSNFSGSMSYCLGFDVGGQDGPGIHLLEPSLDLAPGDRILLCSDGIEPLADDEKLIQMLLAGNARQVCEGIVREIIACAFPRQDNVTLIVIDLQAMPGRPLQSLKSTF